MWEGEKYLYLPGHQSGRGQGPRKEPAAQRCWPKVSQLGWAQHFPRVREPGGGGLLRLGGSGHNGSGWGVTRTCSEKGPSSSLRGALSSCSKPRAQALPGLGSSRHRSILPRISSPAPAQQVEEPARNAGLRSCSAPPHVFFLNKNAGLSSIPLKASSGG